MGRLEYGWQAPIPNFEFMQADKGYVLADVK